MIRILGILIVLSMLLFARERQSFAFFGMGVQSIEYDVELTDNKGQHFYDKMAISGSVYHTGTGAKYNEKWSFDIFAGSSFSAARSKEGYITDPSGIQIKHSGDFYLSEVLVHANYALAPRQDLVMGLGYSNETLKRYLFEFNDETFPGVMETDTVAAVAELGYSFNNLYQRQKFYYDLSLLVNLPFVAYTSELHAIKSIHETNGLNFTYGVGILPRIRLGYALGKEWFVIVMGSYYYRYYKIPDIVEYENTKESSPVLLQADSTKLYRIRSSIFINWRF